MEVIYREEQVESTSKKLNLSKQLVACILNNYIAYLKELIEQGKSVKFLNICYLRVEGDLNNRELETLAYIATEIGSYLDVGGSVVLRVLKCFEDQVLETLKAEKGFSVRGLVRIKLSPTVNGDKLRIRKSTVYNNKDVYVITLCSFRRKFEYALSAT